SSNVFAANELWINSCPPSADPGATVQFDVYGEWDFPVEPDTLTSLQFGLNYNQEVLDCTGATKGALFSGFGLSNNDLAGDFRVLMNDGTGVGIAPNNGSIATFTCTVVGAAGSSTSVTISGGYADSFVFLVNPGPDEYIDEVTPTITGDCTFNVSLACTDADDDTFAVEGGACGDIDCDDSNAAVHPGAAETCNNVDDDCDGVTDDGIASVPTTCGIGACAATGQSTCQGGQMVDSCTPGTPQAEGPFGNATCSDQVDNDCDGTTDAEDTGCAQQCTPSTEVCDGIDNNCDGSIDEGIAAVRITCGTGICKRGGLKTCVNGSLVDSCTPGTPQTEGPFGNATCSDQIDNDCDGSTDATDSGCVQQCTPSTEICDGLDNDCDGQVDEDITPVPTSCGIGACAKTGQKTCQGGLLVDSCTPGTPQTEGPFGNATCSDQIDNDCDGATDATDSGCAQQCTPSTEICDGLDNDCDGQVDEDITPVPTSCGIGACAKTGQKTCQGGLLVDNCTPGTPSVETCNNVDDDCDGVTDNGIAAVPTTCGIGACAATGESTCQGGQMLDSCTLGQAGTEGPVGNATCSDQIDNDCDGTTDVADTSCVQQCIPSAEVCDGTDNDCDGQVDEDITPVPTNCGIGACAATGQSTCQGGQMVDNCTQGQAGTEGPSGNATCSDQIDNDCDGSTDAADSSCQGTQSGMGQWVGTWFSVKRTLTGKTFSAPDLKFMSDKDVGNGYIHIWSWDPDTKELHYDYYEYIKNEGKWESYTDKLHFFAGTDLKFLFSYFNTDVNLVSAFSGVIEGKVKNGILKSATMKSLGGYYTEVYNDNTLYSTGLQTVTGKMINESRVPVPANVILAH
ncbi:MAG: MopE-related protein, partial [Nitrospirota bacterium]